MPLANVIALLQMLPLTVTLAGAVALHEPVGWRRMVAIMTGFCGMLLIVRPGTSGRNVYTINALLAVFCLTSRDLSSRQMSPQVLSLVITFPLWTELTVLAALESLASLGGTGLGLKRADCAVGVVYFCWLLFQYDGDNDNNGDASWRDKRGDCVSLY